MHYDGDRRNEPTRHPREGGDPATRQSPRWNSLGSRLRGNDEYALPILLSMWYTYQSTNKYSLLFNNTRQKAASPFSFTKARKAGHSTS